MELIEGVSVKALKRISDYRGFLMEIMRPDWPEFRKFGQVYMTACKPNVAKGWHYHKRQTDSFCVVKGTARIVLYDMRKDSKTFGKINEFVVSAEDPKLVQIPAFVCHGFCAEGKEEAFIVNVPSETYNYKEPDEHRFPFDSPEIPYKWNVERGG